MSKHIAPEMHICRGACMDGRADPLCWECLSPGGLADYRAQNAAVRAAEREEEESRVTRLRASLTAILARLVEHGPPTYTTTAVSLDHGMYGVRVCAYCRQEIGHTDDCPWLAAWREVERAKPGSAVGPEPGGEPRR